MAKIPTGGFGRGAGQASVIQTRVGPAGVGEVAQAVGELGQAGMQIADRAQRQQEVELRRQKEEAETVARARALNAQLDYEIEVQDATLQTEDAITTGSMDYRKAGEDFTQRVSQIKAPDIDGLAPEAKLAYDRGIQRTARTGELKVRRAVQTAQRGELRSQVTAGIDKLGKIAGMPDADIDAINLRGEQLVTTMGLQAGLDDNTRAKMLQDFKDRNWTSQATQRAIFARENPEALAKLEHDLSASDGYYADKLDAEKRNALLAQVTTRQQTLLDRAERAQDRLDAKGDRVLAQMERQIASGVPSPPDQMAKWADTVKGTAAEAEFQSMVEQEKTVQQVLRLAPDQQQTFVQNLEAKLMTEGGTVAQKANLDRLKNALQANQQQLLDAPLLYNASREGGTVEPLKVQALASPADAWEVGAQLNDRMATIQSMRKRWGSQVPERLLLPQEVKVLADTLKEKTAKDQTAMLGQLRTAVMDDKVFNKVMQQLAPDEPVVALAGMLATKERASTTLATHWFKPNKTAGARDVAATMLEGNRLLQGKGDRQFPVPPDAQFRSAFNDVTKEVFAGRPGAADVAMQAVRAYYTGKAAADGDVSGTVDSDRLSEAISASLGSVVDVNGQGKVLAPWGMSATDFEDRAEAAFIAAARQAGLPESTVNGFGAFGLVQQGENTFFVKGGMSFLNGKDGSPLVIRIDGSSQP
ncbi:TPA: hypothetical protein ACGCHH_000820 [Stenotrophomonas maltophilia]